MTGQKWEQLYNVAVLESDWTTAKIDERIEAAEAAIKGRLHEFSLNHGGYSRRKSGDHRCREQIGKSA
jgi:hypothetical protein